MSALNPSNHLVKASLISCLDDPALAGDDVVLQLPDGALLIEDGIIADVGQYPDMAEKHKGVPVIDRTGCLVCPGFVDTHVHYPQTGMVGSYGAQLLEWLDRYTFPEEARFADAGYAEMVAALFLDELLAAGTTTALVFGSVHRESTDILFKAAKARNMRLIAGKAMMDRNVPSAVQDTAQSSIRDTRALINDWHGKARLSYAVTPRFAAACSPCQLKGAAKILDDNPDVLMHTHLSENQDEIAWVESLFPESDHYLGAYADHGLLRNRSVFAHGIHLSDTEKRMLGGAGAAISFCPTSNLFLGSGLFDLKAIKSAGIQVGLGTDIGAGTSFSMLQTINEAYKVGQLQGQPLAPFEALYHATLGGARALHQQSYIGSFEVGKEADFIVLDPIPTRFLGWRLEKAKTLADRLFLYQMMGDDRAVRETYVMGQPVLTLVSF